MTLGSQRLRTVTPRCAGIHGLRHIRWPVSGFLATWALTPIPQSRFSSWCHQGEESLVLQREIEGFGPTFGCEGCGPRRYAPG